MVETKRLILTKRLCMINKEAMHDLELHFAEKEKRTQTRKLERFLSKSKGCRDDEIYHWFITRNKHGMVTRLTC